MAKGQKRSGREPKKPKKVKKSPAVPPSGGAAGGQNWSPSKGGPKRT